MTPTPPRLALWLLERRLPAEWREFVLGDLEEEFHARHATSPLAARRWFWRQTRRCLIAPLPAGRAVTIDSSTTQGDPMIRTLLVDTRYALRVLLRAPAFALSVIAVFALGIGANTAIFSIVNAVLLRPLPFDEPDRLVRLFHVPPQSTFPGMKTFAVSPANFYDWQRDARSFEAMAIYRFRPFTLTGGTAESVLAGAVGAGFFDLVRTPPALGRVFRADEDTPDRSKVVVLSDGFWKSHFGAAADVLGRTMMLDGEPYTIVGVMPARFSMKAWGASGRDLWVPLAYTDKARAVRENHNAQAVARLKPGVGLAQAEAEMRAISTRLEHQYPQANAGWSATVIPLQELIVGNVRSSLLMLLAAVGLVLLIACANVGNLLFTRALGRRKEIAIRAALGAGRGRVFQQLLVEALVLAVAGGAAGLLLARAGLGAAAQFLAGQVPRADDITLDGRVLLFVAGASAVAALLAGALPALRVGRADLNDALKEGGRNDSAVGLRTRRLLIVCEVALSLVLLMGAGVMLRTLAALGRVDAGFDAGNVLTLHVELPATRYATPETITTFFATALDRIRALPGVESAAATDDVPLSGGGSQQPIVVDGRAELLPRDQPTVAVRKITPAFLRTLRIPLLEGRDIAESDVDVMLVSRAAARMLWGDTDPVGHQATLPLQSKTRTLRVVGVVGDIRDNGLADAPVATVYEYTRAHAWNSLSFVVRTSVPPASLAQPAANAVRALDREQPVEDIRPLTEVVNDTLIARRFSALLLGLFASVALVLATVGIYSVLSYIVRGRSHEIGIRTALGARSGDVVWMVVVEGMTPTAVGIVVGAVAAVAAGTALRTLVFGVSASDPVTLAAVAGALAVVALIACLVPAYRASQLDPLTVLRAD